MMIKRVAGWHLEPAPDETETGNFFPWYGAFFAWQLLMKLERVISSHDMVCFCMAAGERG